MTDQTIKSRPQYSPLRIDAGGKRHLLLSDTSCVPAGCLAPGMQPGDFNERWTIARHSRAIPDPANASDHAFRSESHMFIALRRRLGSERMGFRLYAVGTEPFLWNVFGTAQEFGMSRNEVALWAHGSGARRVFCNHCRTISEGVTTNVTTCSGCGANLFVRDHFSRRLNAFAGVQVDAEVPGEIPEIKEIYS